MRLLRSYFSRFLRHRTRLLIGVLSVPLAQAGDVATTILAGQAIDRARTGSAPHAEWLTTLLVLLGVAALVHAFFRFWQRWLIVIVSRRFEVELKQDLFDHLVRLDFGFFSRSRSGDLVSRLTADVESLRMFLGPGLMYTLGAVVVVPISLGWLLTLNPLLSLAIAIPMIAVGLSMKALTPRLHRESTAVQESLADLSHRAQEDFGGIRVVKGYHREASQAARFERSSARNRDNQVLLGVARGITNALINGSFQLTFAVILLLGGLAAIDRDLPIGELFQFVDLTLKVFWPLIALGWIAGMYPRAVASAERVEALLATGSPLDTACFAGPALHTPSPTQAEGGGTPPEPSPTPAVRPQNRHHPRKANEAGSIGVGISMRGVGFTYPDSSRPALQEITFELPPGGSLGVVGPTGSGKSTLLLLLGRQFDPTRGAVMLDGIPLADLPLQQVRKTFGYVPQDAFLFSATLEENIRFGSDTSMDDQEVAELIEAVALDSEVARFPAGQRTLIGERGVTLSGGQRQRTCIARALARRPRALILDDCLSAVDTGTEAKLLQTLRAASDSCTLVITAHRLATVSACNEILVLDAEGRIAARGKHAALIKTEGWYQQTWARQQRRDSLNREAHL